MTMKPAAAKRVKEALEILVFVSAFPDRKTFTKFHAAIA